MSVGDAAIPAARKADRVANDLLSRVVSGEIAVGSTLPREGELATHYDVNRTVVREAIKLLEVHRLVRPVRRRGTLALDPTASLSPDVLRAMLRPKPGVVDRTMLASFLEIRATLDVQMTTLAAERRTERDLDAMTVVIEQLTRSIGDDRAHRLATDAMALAIARATHNRIFEMLAYWHQDVARDLDELFRTVRPANEAHVQGLTLLVELIRQRDAESLRSLVTAFHEWATPRLIAGAALASGVPLDQILEHMK